MREPVVHLLQGVDDEVDGGSKRAGNSILAHQSVIKFGPVFDAVGEALVVDDNQQIKVALVALGCVRLVDPSAAR
jgi:hypothetical protein